MKKIIVAILIPLCLVFFPKSLRGQSASDTMRSENIKESKFDVGGEMRFRIRNYNRINFGDVTPPDKDYDTYLNLRGLFFADFQINKTFRLFTQLYTGTTFAKDDLSASDKDILDIGPMYLEIKLNKIPVSIQAGRQLLNYGSAKILGTSDNPNSVKSFDAITSEINLGKTTGNLILARPVINEIDIFDNPTDYSSLIYGSFWNINMDENKYLDLYLFGNQLKEITFNDYTANETRYTLGGRFGNIAGNFFYESEAAWQFGSHGIQNISGYYLSSGVGYGWETSALKPVLEIRGTIYSGDRDSTDNMVNIFRPVYARPPVSSMAPIGPSNIVMLTSDGTITIADKLDVNLRYYAIWRLTANDGLYSSRMDRATREPDIPGDKKGMFVTSGLSVRVDYNPSEHLNINFSTGFFYAGKYLANTGIGKNVQANFLVATYSF